MHDAQSTGDAGRTVDGRDRVTVDLRGLGARVNAAAGDRQMTAAALVRHALVELLDQGPSDEDDRHADSPHHAAAQSPPIKVTLRMSGVHALLLARRARAADVSQGRYVASLIEGMPVPPRPPDYSRTVTALLTSSDVHADPNLTHPADPIVTRGWALTVWRPAVDKCRSMAGLSTSWMQRRSRGGSRAGRSP